MTQWNAIDLMQDWPRERGTHARRGSLLASQLEFEDIAK